MKKAYILCSGLGNKMWPYCDKWQKCCIPIGNIPNIIRLINNIKASGIEDITIISNYKSQQVSYYLKDVKGITILEENNSLGTAKSLLNALENEDCNEFLVVYGDTAVDEQSIKDVITNYNTNGPSLLIQELKDHLISTDWICSNSNNGKIISIYGHPRSHYVNSRIAGIFALNRSVIPYLKANPGHMLNVSVGGMPIEECMLEQSLQMMLENSITLYGVYVQNYYIDLDKPWNILEANKAIIMETMETMEKLNSSWVEKSPLIDNSAIILGKLRLGKGSRIGRNVIIKGDVLIGDNTVIDNGAIIEGNNIIGDNCIITDNCKISEYTTVGNNNKIGYNAEVQGITFDKVCIVHTSEVYGVIGTSTDIAAGCMMGILRFDDMPCRQKINGKVENGNKYTNGIFIGDYVRTGILNIFYPGVKVGSNCALGPGLIVDNDIPSGKLVLVDQNKIIKEWGPDRYEW